VSAPLRPVAVQVALAGELDGAKFDAMLAFPQIAGGECVARRSRASTIDDKDVDVVQGNAPGGLIAREFDRKSGCRVRAVRHTASPVGRIPGKPIPETTEVAGVKIPHSFTLTWLDGRDTPN
jgi:hypothetical protein